MTLDSAFDRDRFLMKQKLLTVQQRYDIADDAGHPILFVERPQHHLASIISIGLFLVVVFVVGIVAPVALESIAGDPRGQWAERLAGPLLAVGVLLGAVVAIAAVPKRHVSVYRSASKSEKLVEILQDAKFQPFVMTFTVRDGRGAVLALLRKNVFTNILRRRWDCLFTRGTTESLFGEFNREFTLLDRYVIDLSRDPRRTIARRLALATGIMLDSGERR